MFRGVFSRFGALKDMFSGQVNDDAPAAACPQTRWDQIVSGFNRTIRPIILFGVISLFFLAWYDPSHFTLFAKALKELPEFAWYTIFTILSFWFAGKGIRDARQTHNPNGNGTEVDSDPVEPTPKTPEIEEHEDQVTALPAGNDAIQAWKNANNGAKPEQD